jgi:transcriptional regulator with XRE-family HTH domain
MTTGQGPTTTRRRLRAELRSLRQAKGMSLEDVTNEVEWSTSKLIRIEGGQVGISVSDLNALLLVYGVGDRARQEELRALARNTRQRTWWSAYQRYIPATYLEFIGAESDATRIRHYHPTIVPGLFQTRAYADAIIEATALDQLAPDVVRARDEVRMARQQHVLDRPEPPSITVILDEAALHRLVGGQATMREQLDHLILVAERDSVNMLVVPFSAGPHPGLMGAFALLEYNDPLDDDVLCLETAANDVILRDHPALIERYRVAADRLEETALHEPATIQIMAEMRDSFR